MEKNRAKNLCTAQSVLFRKETGICRACPSRRKGFLLLWVLFAVFLISTLAAGILTASRAAAEREAVTDIRTDLVLLAQDMTEKEKARVRFGTGGADTGTVTVNGRVYERSLSESDRTVEGVPMKDIRCTVRAENGLSFTAETMVDL